MESLGTMDYDINAPAKLIVGNKEIDVIVRCVTQYINEEKNLPYKRVMVDDKVKYAGVTDYVKRIYQCEEYTQEHKCFL